jgi:hypothetical protein
MRITPLVLVLPVSLAAMPAHALGIKVTSLQGTADLMS